MLAWHLVTCHPILTCEHIYYIYYVSGRVFFTGAVWKVILEPDLIAWLENLPIPSGQSLAFRYSSSSVLADIPEHVCSVGMRGNLAWALPGPWLSQHVSIRNGALGKLKKS